MVLSRPDDFENGAAIRPSLESLKSILKVRMRAASERCDVCARASKSITAGYPSPTQNHTLSSSRFGAPAIAGDFLVVMVAASSGSSFTTPTGWAESASTGTVQSRSASNTKERRLRSERASPPGRARRLVDGLCETSTCFVGLAPSKLVECGEEVAAALTRKRFGTVAAFTIDREIPTLKFASTRLIAADIKAMVAFYEMVTGLRAEWLAPTFAEIVTPAAALAIGAAETVALWKEGSAEPGANRTAYLEFQVDDIDAAFDRLKGHVQLVHELKIMPWGNKTFQFRDPEGTAISLYMPATEEAKKRFAGR